MLRHAFFFVARGARALHARSDAVDIIDESTAPLGIRVTSTASSPSPVPFSPSTCLLWAIHFRCAPNHSALARRDLLPSCTPSSSQTIPPALVSLLVS
ncbi:hypothetical protein MRX96_010726 [Rhipicephalus microplus]